MKTEDTFKDPTLVKLFAEGGEVRPSAQFANHILQKIKIETKSNRIAYTPLISRKAWLFLTFSGVAMFVAVYFTSKTQASTGTDLFGLSFRPDFTFIRQMAEKVAISFEFSPVMKTSLLAMCVFIIVQMILLEWRNRSIFK